MVYYVNGNPISSDESLNVGSQFSIEPFCSDDQQALISTFDGIIALYDALVTAYPDYVTKNTLTSGSFTNYEYVFTTGSYNSYQTHAYAMDAEIAKPKVLVTAGVHGYERTSVLANYVFFKALCEGKAGLKYVREAIEFRTIPVVNPWGFNNDSRYNSNSVDLNRNFDADWVSRENSGSSAASEAETKLVQSWIASNSDAKVLIDHHNSEIVNEICLIQSIGKEDDAIRLKESAMKTANHILTHWKIDRMLPSTCVFFYTGTSTADKGFLSMYARDRGISSYVMETSWNVNSTGEHSKTTIGVSAESQAIVLLGMCVCLRDES